MISTHSNKKEVKLTKLLDDCLDCKLSQSERVILQKAKSDLEKKNSYFPRIVADLESSLRPLAINQKLSDSVKLLYMTITSHEYKNKGLGIGLMSIGQWL